MPIDLRKDLITAAYVFSNSLFPSPKKGLNSLRCKPLEYTIDINTGDINGLILETNNIVPILNKPIKNIKSFHGLRKSVIPNYECIVLKSITDSSIHTF